MRCTGVFIESSSMSFASELKTSGTAELYPDWIVVGAMPKKNKISLYSSQNDYDIVLQVVNGHLTGYRMRETKK
jgi:hypothetical protein